MARSGGLVAFVLAACACAVAVDALGEPARGWGDTVTWRGFAEGLALAQQRNMPALVIFHRDWCSACKRTKAEIAKAKDFISLSENFVMINIQDENESEMAEYQPDGAYVPRILFFDVFSPKPATTEMKEKKEDDDDEKVEYEVDYRIMPVTNSQGNKQYAYFYSSSAQLVASMRTALEKFRTLHGAPNAAAAVAAGVPASANKEL
eukprot:TRINITY_DN714_c0_g1_i1.p1 TRINITY_DN714_c0_g1~~TRINITY_DN714_c0_g1_i1.p1  ORF type:complete len:206 (+),score=79.78 TRINITY_DN714_c0_g1_i1:931-1548(+)